MIIGNFLLESVLIGICAGIISGIYIKILAYEPVLNWWFRFGARFENKWFFAPIWGCIKCNSGQFGLWAFIFLKIIPLITQSGHFQAIGCPALSLAYLYAFGLVLTISAAILTGLTLALFINWITQTLEKQNNEQN